MSDKNEKVKVEPGRMDRYVGTSEGLTIKKPNRDNQEGKPNDK